MIASIPVKNITNPEHNFQSKGLASVFRGDIFLTLISFTMAIELQLFQISVARSFILRMLETGPRLSPLSFLQNAELPRGYDEDVSVEFVSTDDID
jgi:hypothetical protein